MKVIEARNVNQALPIGIDYLLTSGVRESSRNGEVLVSPVPVTTVYSNPTERVMFSAVRDANPFFHLAESLWMLAGSNDASFLDRYVSTFGSRFAERDGSIHGAYGMRWRNQFGFDQLIVIASMLRDNPETRQCVLQMWDASINQHGCDDLCGNWKDRPCNTHAYFRTRTENEKTFLDITVCCRSNDIVWGAYGANAVHFSVLHEVVAALAGLHIGKYYQISNNYHAYTSEIERLEKRAGSRMLDYALYDDRYHSDLLLREPIVADADSFLTEIDEFYFRASTNTLDELDEDAFSNPWIIRTLWPALEAHAVRKDLPRAMQICDQIFSEDWKIACSEWIGRRSA